MNNCNFDSNCLTLKDNYNSYKETFTGCNKGNNNNNNYQKSNCLCI